MDLADRSLYFYCLNLIYNNMKGIIEQMWGQEMLDTSADPKALWHYLMRGPMHGGILLTFYHWL